MFKATKALTACVRIGVAASFLGISAHSAFSAVACDISGRLDEQMSGVTKDSVAFSDSGKSYPAIVLSLAQQSPWNQNFICLRYEIENRGTEGIPLLYWDLVNEYSATDLAPADVLKRYRTRPSSYQHGLKSVTSIRAFRSAEVQANVWRTVEDAQKKTSSTKTLDFAVMKSSEADFAAAAAIRAGKFADTQVTVFKLTGQDLPPVMDGFAHRLGQIATISRARYDEGKGSISFGEVKITAANSAAQVRVYAPVLQALIQSETTEKFVSQLQDARERRTPLVLTENAFRYGALTPKSMMYVIEHPVTLHWSAVGAKDEFACIIVATYSPFPLNVGKDFCIWKS